MYGNLNPGLLICHLVSSDSKNDVEGGTAQLTWIEGDSSFGGRLKIIDTKGRASLDAQAQSDSAGVAFVEFFWEPTQLGWTVSDTPQIRFNGKGIINLSKEVISRNIVFSDDKVDRGFHTAYGTSRMALCVNLRQVMTSGAGVFQFRGNTSSAITIGQQAKKILDLRAQVAKLPVPPLHIFKFMRPSVEMLSLLGATEIAMKPNIVAWP